MKQIRIALVQMRSPFADLKNNLKKISRLARDAAAQEVDIICYPELCLQGYSRTESCLHAQPIPGPYTEKILALAQTYKLTMLVGLAEQTEYNKPYITHFVAYPDGKWDLYRKTHLGSGETIFFTRPRTACFPAQKSQFWDFDLLGPPFPRSSYDIILERSGDYLCTPCFAHGVRQPAPQHLAKIFAGPRL